MSTAASSFDGALKGVIDGQDPAVHVILRGRLIYPFEVWSDDFETETPLGISSLTDRGHSEINRIDVWIQFLLPIAVF